MKTILIILILFTSISLLSQPISNRSSTAITVQDGNLFALNSFRPAVHLDTSAANAVTTLDSCGKQIFTYSDNSYWLRACSPKRWIKLLKTGDVASVTWGSITGTLSNQTDLQNALNLKFNISDTTNKWVQDVYGRNDSLFKFKNGIETLVDDFPQLTAENGITRTLNAFLLGGTLNQNTTINTGGLTTTWTGANDNETSFSVANTGTTNASAIAGSATGTTSVGVNGTSSLYIGVLGTSTSNNGVQGQSISGPGVVGASTTGPAFRGQINPASTNAIENVVTLFRSTSSGAGANGIGAAIQFELETATSGTSQTAGSIAFQFTDATNATRTSQFEIYGVNAATSGRKAALAGTGQWTWDGYPALPAQTDSTTYKPVGIDGSGNVVKMANWFGSGGGGGNNLYNIDSFLSTNRIVSQAGRYLRFQEASNNYSQFNGALRTMQPDSSTGTQHINRILPMFAGTTAQGAYTWYEHLSSASQTPDRPNTPYMRGWNLGPGGAAVTAGQPAIGESWEPYYKPSPGDPAHLMEYHKFFIQASGTQRRLESWTVQANTNAWSVYYTTPAWSLRDTLESDYVYASTASGSDRTTVFGLGSGNGATQSQFIANGTEDMLTLNSLSIGQFEFANFSQINFGNGNGYNVTDNTWGVTRFAQGFDITRISSPWGLHLKASGGGSAIGSWIADSDAGEIRNYAAAGYFNSLYGGGVEAFRASTTGNMLVGQTTDNADGKIQITGTGVFNGTDANALHIKGSNAGRRSILIENSDATASSSLYVRNNRASFDTYGGMLTGGSSDANTLFGLTNADRTFLFHAGANGTGLGIGTLNNTVMVFGTNDTERMRITGAGAISFNTSSNSYIFPLARASAGQVLTDVSATGVLTWETPSSGGITTLNTLTATTQTFATGTSGSDFNISSTTSTHTFNIPSASTTNRGLITASAQTLGGEKTFVNGVVVNSVGQGAAVVISGNRSAATAPGVGGIGLSMAAFTYTSTAGAGTESGNQNLNTVNAPTLTSANAIPYTGDVATIRFAGAPIAAGSTTIEHPYNILAVDVSKFDGLALSLNEQSGDATLASASGVNVYTGAGGNTFTLPVLATHPGKILYIKNAGGGNLTVARAGADNIYDTSSVTSITIAAGAARMFMAGSSFWYVQ